MTYPWIVSPSRAVKENESILGEVVARQLGRLSDGKLQALLFRS